MSSKRHLRRQECGNKRPFATLEEAIAVTVRMGHEHHEAFRAYACGRCHKYHVGHPQVREQRKTRAQFNGSAG